MTEQNRSAGWPKKRLFRFWALLFFAVLSFLTAMIPMPYYVSRPGSAIELGPIVDVEGGAKSQNGSFMLTTVRMGEANLAWYLLAKVWPGVELVDEALVVGHGESYEDFAKREQLVMKSSQKLAEAVAFRQAGYDVKVENQGVVVMGLIEGMPAKGTLKIGDTIMKMDGVPITTTQDLLARLAGKTAADTVELTYQRDGKQLNSRLRLAKLPDSQGTAQRYGLGIIPENKQTVDVPKKVTISTEGIGGPSAGLMMTLEIYDQIRTDLNLTRGYRIAGTGTINADGTVGRIGGIQQKVMAADQAGAEIFFAPNDEGSRPSNYQEAMEAGERIGTSMRIVPVRTVDDAIRFLQSLPPKAS